MTSSWFFLSTRKTCVEVAGRRTFRVLTSSQQSGIKSKKKIQYAHSTTSTHKITTTIHTTNQQQLHTRQLKTNKIHTRQIRIQHVQKVKTPKQESTV